MIARVPPRLGPLRERTRRDGRRLRGAGRAPGLLLFLARIVGGLLLGRLYLRIGVGLFHELPAALPAERPRDEDDREEDVPRGREELLRDGVGGRVSRARHAAQR